jgi:hypothetical protein
MLTQSWCLKRCVVRNDLPSSDMNFMPAATAGSSNPCPTDLWEQFRDGLEVCGYFAGISEGSPEHAARMKAAETTFENSLKVCMEHCSTSYSSLKALDLKKDLCMNMPLTLSFIAMEQKFRDSTTEEKDAQIVAEAFKVQGNASMKEQRFVEAIQFYTLAISLCGNNAIFYANR